MNAQPAARRVSAVLVRVDVHRELHQLSRELLEGAGGKDPERATLLLSVSKVIKTPFAELIAEISGGADAGC